MKRMRLLMLSMLIAMASIMPTVANACHGCMKRSDYDFTTQNKVIKAIDDGLRWFYSKF